MKKIYKFPVVSVMLSASMFLTTTLSAQNIGINATGTAPVASAGLDVDFTNKGLLIPRVALTATNAAGPIAAPAISLFVYNTATAGISPNNVTPGYYYWDGSNWVRFSTGNKWDLLGNTGTVIGTNFLGTTDNVSLAFRTNNTERMRILNTGNVGIGTTTPGYTLDLNTGTFAFGNGNVRTESRDNAGLQGNVGAQSGFFESASPVNYPAGASSWWHLIDVRHSNNGNNYAMQLSGSFFDQKIYFRKTNNNAAQPWQELLTSANNPVSVSLATDYTVTTAGWANVAPMTVTFTATKTTALVSFTCSGFAYTNSMAYVLFRILNGATSIGGTQTVMQSYDDARGTLTPWSCAFSKNITGLTVGTTYTLQVQAQRNGIYGTYDAVIQAASIPDTHHMTLTVQP